MKLTDRARVHVVIGDTQTKEGVCTAHLRWIGQYIVDKFAGRDVAIIHLGDHWDMPSLSSYDKGKKQMEGRRYKSDVRAGNRAFDLLCKPLECFNAGKRASSQWWPERHFFMGNHEHRITRACELDPQLDGVISLEDLNVKAHGWTVHRFLKPKTIDGVRYAHYFYHPKTGKARGGENIQTRLKDIGHSFSQGHQQGLGWANRPVGSGRHCGLVLGSTYLHDEDYLGPQVEKDAYWRGIVVKHQVERGSYDPMFVSLEWLCRKYEGRTLRAFLKSRKGR